MSQLAFSVPGPSGTITIEGPTGLAERFNNDLSLAGIISATLPILFTIAGLILLGMFIYGGYNLLLSAGDANKAQTAKATVTNAIIGFVILLISFSLTQLITFMFGLN